MEENITREKQELRQKMKGIRDAISASEREQKSQQICSQLATHPRLNTATTIAGYYPVHSEVNLFSFLKNTSARMLLPKITYEKLHFFEVQSFEQLQRGPFGIPEPTMTAPQIELKEIDVLLVPGLAFTRTGQRLGYGKGYYDRVIKQLAPQTSVLGICFCEQLVENIPQHVHDISVDEVLYDQTFHSSAPP